jgi:hypothetical protein
MQPDYLILFSASWRQNLVPDTTDYQKKFTGIRKSGGVMIKMLIKTLNYVYHVFLMASDQCRGISVRYKTSIFLYHFFRTECMRL